jgi:hypothetical protein
VEDLKTAGNLDVGTSKGVSKHSIVAKPSWERTRKGTASNIAAIPANIPFASHIEAANNWAAIEFEKGTDGDGSVEVFF